MTSTLGITPSDAPRYERKFLLESVSPAEARRVIMTHPAGFKEIYQERAINNIYFDSIDLDAYQDAVEGAAYRRKMRIRWYGALMGEIARPVLELKIKQGLLGIKRSFVLPAFTMGSDWSPHGLRSLVAQGDLPRWLIEELRALRPVLVNRYTRRYYQSAQGDHRVTVDTGLCYYRVSGHGGAFLAPYRDRRHCVVELKYGEAGDGVARAIASEFPFRMTKSSKFTQGMALMHAQ